MAVFNLTGANEVQAGTATNDRFNLGTPTGDDVVAGRQGFDTVAVSGNSDDYTIELDGNEFVLTNTVTNEVTTLRQIENVEFTDKTVLLVGPASSYTTVQSAIDAANDGDTVLIGPGTYDEQLTVNGFTGLDIEAVDLVGGGKAAVTIEAPDMTVSATASTGRDVNAVISVTNSTDVDISDITVDGAGQGDTIDSNGGQAQFVGVFYAGTGAGNLGTLTNVDVTGVRGAAGPATGAGGDALLQASELGTGVFVDVPNGTNSFAVNGGTVDDFGSAGVNATGGDVTINGVTVNGSGAQTNLVQNGIILSSVASADLDGNTINEVGFDGAATVYSAGVLVNGGSDIDIADTTILGANADTTDARVGGIIVVDLAGPPSNVTIADTTADQVDVGVSITGDVADGNVSVSGTIAQNLDTTDPFAAGVEVVPTIGSTAVFNRVDGSPVDDVLSGAQSNDFLVGLNGDDFMDGQSGNDTMNGGAGDDSMLGGDGNDFMIGSTGADTMRGGLGDDIYIVADMTDVVGENASSGTDTVRTALNALTLAANVENLVFTGAGAFTGTGNASDNTITGGTGNDSLFGLAGDDTLEGGDGVDRLDAGAGTDSLIGGAGNDLYILGDVTDVVVENVGEGTDRVHSSTFDLDLGLYANVEQARLLGTASLDLTGTANADRLIGNSGNNRLDGLAGNDVLIGGTGNDTYVIDSAGDLVIEAANGGVDTIISDTVSIDLSGLGEVERAELTGAANLDIVGNAAGNLLTGNAGDNDITGGLGVDVMTGGAGADNFIFETATDSGVGALRDRVQDFEAGVDRIDLSGIDAIAGGGDDMFTVVTTAPSSAGELRLINGANFTRIQADVDGGGFDFEIVVFGVNPVTAADIDL